VPAIVHGAARGDLPRVGAIGLGGRGTTIAGYAAQHGPSANICIRLGRRITWDPKQERILDDPEADAWQRRAQRQGFEIEA
jgi:hypothetical protein